MERFPITFEKTDLREQKQAPEDVRRQTERGRSVWSAVAGPVVALMVTHGEERMQVEGSVTVGRPLRDVFGYLSDLSGGARWASGVTESRMTSGGALALGATVRFLGNFLGEHLESSAEVVGYEPDRTLRCKSVSGPVPYLVQLTLDELQGGVRVTERVEADVRFFRLGEALVWRVAQRQLEHDLQTLKDLLEAANVSRPSHRGGG